MAARKGPRKLYRYSAEFKLKAVKLSQIEGVRVQDVADALEIHPFMLSKWRRDACAGRIRAQVEVEPATLAQREVQQLAQVGRFLIFCLWFISSAAWCETHDPDAYGWSENGVLVPDTPSKGHDGPFLAHMFVVDDSERLYQDWFTKPDNPRARHVSRAKPGTEIEIVVVFVRCEPDTSGNCQVWGTATVTTGDGRTLIDNVAVPLYVNHPPLPGAALGISEHGLGMVVEDFRGFYRFEMLVEDRVARRKVPLVQELTVDTNASAPSN